MKSLNRGVILGLLRRESSLSRIELSRLTGLDAKTITNLVREMLEEKVVIAVGYQKKKKGRNPQNINLNEEYGYSLGVDLGASHIRVGLVNFKAELVFCREELITSRDTRASIVEKMVYACLSILKKFPDKRDKIRAVCLAAPGFLNRGKGEIVRSVNLPGFTSVPIGKILRHELGLPFYLEESSRAMARAEGLFGAAKNQKNFILLDLGVGLGTGIVIDRHLYRGVGEIAGEVGHIVVEVKGRRCDCGRRGCLETIASGAALARLGRQLFRSSSGKKLRRICGRDAEVDAQVLARAALNGDTAAVNLFDRAGNFLGLGLANLINLFDIPVIIISGRLAEAGDLILNPMKRSLEKHLLFSTSRKARLIKGRLGKDSALLGAASLAWDGLFTPSF